MSEMPFCGLWRLCLLNCTLTLAMSLQRVDLENHTWANYFLAAYKVSVIIFSPCTDLTALALFSTQSIAQFAVKVFLQGVFEFLDKKGKAPSPAGLQVMLHGQVPTGECLLLQPACALTVACYTACYMWRAVQLLLQLPFLP